MSLYGNGATFHIDLCTSTNPFQLYASAVADVSGI
jgi:hypothetical protein